MSTFLLHQESSYVALLADSFGAKSHGAGVAAPSLPVVAPKLVHLATGVYAAHAGTFQPAIDMLSDLGERLPEAITWEAMTSGMKEVGDRVYARYKEIFKSNSFDVRIAIIVTGDRRHPSDIERNIGSSILLWELARAFEPHRVTGHIYFGGSVVLTEFATDILAQPLLAGMLRQGPLAAAQALVATHAALSKLSSTISAEPNVVIIGDGDEHTVLHGALLTLAQARLVKG